MEEIIQNSESIYRMAISLNKTYAVRVPCGCCDGYAEIQWGILSAVDKAYCNRCKVEINLDKTLHLLKTIREYMQSERKPFSLVFLSDRVRHAI